MLKKAKGNHLNYCKDQSFLDMSEPNIIMSIETNEHTLLDIMVMNDTITIVAGN